MWTFSTFYRSQYDLHIALLANEAFQNGSTLTATTDFIQRSELIEEQMSEMIKLSGPTFKEKLSI